MAEYGIPDIHTREEWEALVESTSPDYGKPKGLTVYVAMVWDEEMEHLEPIAVYSDVDMAVEASEDCARVSSQPFVVDEFAKYWREGLSPHKVTLEERGREVVALNVTSSLSYQQHECIYCRDLHEGVVRFWVWKGFALHGDDAIARAKLALEGVG